MTQPSGQSDTLCVHDWGACSPLGYTARTSAAAAWADVSRVAAPRVPIGGAAGDTYQAASPLFDAETPLGDRMVGLTVVALTPMLEALHKEPGLLTIFVALPEYVRETGAFDATVQALQDALAPLRRGPQQSLSVKGLTGSQGAFAMGLDVAARYLATGASRLCFVGGVDSLVARCRQADLHTRKALYDPETGDGCIAGEAAAFLCVSRSLALQGRPVLAEITSWHTSAPHRGQPQSTSSGATLARALRAVLPNCAPGAHGAGCGVWVNDDTGETWRAEALAHVYAAPDMPRLDWAQTLHPARLMGEVGTAFGALSSITAIFGLRHGLTAGPQAVLSAQDPGCATAWCLEAPQIHPSALACDGPWRTFSFWES